MVLMLDLNGVLIAILNVTIGDILVKLELDTNNAIRYVVMD